MENLFFYDQQIVSFLSNLQVPLLVDLSLWLTELGGLIGLMVVTSVVIVFLLAKKNYLYLRAFLFSLLSGGVLGTLIKMIIQRPRPESVLALYDNLSYSFPSRHAILGLILYGFIAYIFWHQVDSKKIKWVVVIFCASIILIIGFTRLYLGVHYLSDVLAGYILGGLCLMGGRYYIVKS